MSRNRRGEPPRHTLVIRELMRDQGWQVVDVLGRSLANGRPVSQSTFSRALSGREPLERAQAAIAGALSRPEDGCVINAAQIFGSRPLPLWASEIVDGIAVAA